MEFDLLKDLESTVEKYRKLTIIDSEVLPGLQGYLELINPENGLAFDEFMVKLVYNGAFPYTFPKVFELENRIEKVPNRHVMSDDQSLCLAVEPEIKLACKYGITTSWFIENVLLPRLAEEYLVLNSEKYQREYSHGSDGYWEYFMNFFQSKDFNLILSLIDMSLSNNMPKGYASCPCGSNRKFKSCHRKSVFGLQKLGRSDVQSILRILIFHPYKGAL